MTNEEAQRIVDNYNRDSKRGFLVSPSNDPNKWPVCKKCGKHKHSIFADTEFCLQCDRESK